MHSFDRVQAHTAERVNQRIQQEAEQRIIEAAIDSKARLSERIRRLEREWDIERWLEMNASALAFSGVALGLIANRKFFALPMLVLPFLFLHATQGWCPPIPLMRRLGIRTQQEIDDEKFALKALRGDFAHLDDDIEPATSSGRHAWDAATN